MNHEYIMVQQENIFKICLGVTTFYYVLLFSFNIHTL